MEPNPYITAPPASPPVTPKQGLSTPLVVAITSSVFLSLCCFCSSLPMFTGFFHFYYTINGEKTYLPGYFGICCIGAGFVPWIVTVILWLVTRQKKNSTPSSG
jgi:hypothetical protein